MSDSQNNKMAELYWLTRLAGDIPKLVLPGLESDGAGRHSETVRPEFSLDQVTVEKLQEMGNQSDPAMFILVLTGLNILFYRYTGIEDLVIGTLTPREEGVKDKILFSRNKISGAATFKETINQVKETVMEAFAYTDFSFGVLLQRLITANEGKNPEIFNVAFIYDAFQERGKLLNQFDLVFILSRKEKEVCLEVQYSPGLYPRELVENFSRNLIHVLDQLAGQLETKLADIDIVSAGEKQRLISFNDTQIDFPVDKTLPLMIEEQAARTPDLWAVLGKGLAPDTRSLRYRELNEQANRLAWFLREKGVKPNSIVGLLLDRSPEMVVAQLAIMKAGGAYLPLDPDAPENRIVNMLEDCHASFLLTAGSVADKYSYTALQSLNLQSVKLARLTPYFTPARERILDFNALPLPDRSLIDNEKYNRYIGQSVVKNRMFIEASRGCPFNCSYCYRTSPRKQVPRKGQHLFEEIKLYYDVGIRKFDIFMLNIKEGKRLFELIIENRMTDVQLFFPNGFRGDYLTKEYVDLMVKAGTVNFALALETASPRLQQLINKNLHIDRFREIIEYVCEKYPQVILELFTMHGIPTETEEEALMTLEFIKSLKWVHFPYVNVLKIYHNTGMEQLALDNGISADAIARSENLAWHELSDTLPFDKSFSSTYQARFLTEYLLSKERLLQVLPYQMKILTEDEIVQKYDSYLPADIKSFDDILNFARIKREELGNAAFVDEKKDEQVLAGLNERIARQFPKKTPAKDAIRVLLLDLSQFFSDGSDMLYDVVDPPLGLICILSYLNEKLGERIDGKILKSRLDFDSLQELRQMMGAFQPQVLGVRSLSYYRDFFHEAIAAIRQWGFNIPIITGGPYATVDYDTILLDRNIDAIVLSEGESSFHELIEKILENNGKMPGDEVLKGITGIAFVPREQKEIRENMAREIIKLDQVNEGIGRQPVQNLPPVNRPDDLAYTIFTSGSTGNPKGVLIEHRNVVNVIEWFARYYGVTEGTRVIQLTNYTFDPSVEQIYSTLAHGGILFIPGKELIANRAEFIDYMDKNRIQIINFVPGTLRELLFPAEKLESLQAVISGGEKLDDLTRNQLMEKGYTLYNHYGPTETTIDTLAARCSPGKITLGRPVDNVNCYIIAGNGAMAPIGVTGELCIAGAGVSRGYLNNPELTAEKFVYVGAKRNVAERGAAVIPGTGMLNRIAESPQFVKPQAKLNTVLAGSEEEADERSFGSRSNCSLCLNFAESRCVSPAPDVRLYKTGDLCRWLSDGTIEFLGRRDHQVKIRGFRIELGEIESRLLRHHKVKEAVVIVVDVAEAGNDDIRDKDKSGKYLSAYIVQSADVSGVELRDYLAWELPDYMVPSNFTILPSLPLNPNGKVDRRALLEMEKKGVENRTEYVPPKNELEKKLVEVWEKVLDRQPVGVKDNFFMLGGDSVKSIQIASRMNTLGYRFEMRDLFHNPTIEKLSPHVKEVAGIVDQGAVTGAVPFTPIQEDFFLRHRTDPQHFNQAIMLKFADHLDEKMVKAVFNRLQEHHDALRMVYPLKNGQLVQENRGPDHVLDLTVHDFREEESRKNALEKLKTSANDIQAGIDLEKGPLMRLGLFRLADGDRLLIVIHHLVIDGISWRILFEDIETLFRQYRQGENLALPPKTDSFKRWAEKLREYAAGESLSKEKAYWEKLDSTPVTHIEKDLPGDNRVKDSATLRFNLDEAETEKLLSSVNQAFGTEINDILLTALGLSIAELHGGERISIALEGHGREEIVPEVNISRTVGWFTSLYPLVLDVSLEKSLDRQVKEVKETLRQVPYKGIGYGILKYITPPGHKQGMAFRLDPRISFNYLGQFDADIRERAFVVAEESGGSPHSPVGEREYEIDFSGMIANNRLVMSITFGKHQYRQETIQKLLGRYKERLQELIAYCTSRDRRELTPSDFTYKGFSLDTLDRIRAAVQGELEDIYILAPLQEGMLFHTLVDPSSAAYFEQMFYRLRGGFDISLIQKSIALLFERYDVLRTNFVYENIDRPLQVVIKNRDSEFHYEDISALPTLEQKEAYIKEYKIKDRQRPFDLVRGSLMRVSVIKPQTDEYEFVWSHHHLLMDGWCAGILVEEFFELYCSLTENRTPRLPSITPYRVYLSWLEKQDKEASRMFWQEYLAGYETAALVPRLGAITPGPGGYQREILTLVFPPEKKARLADLTVKYQATMNTLVQSVWGILLGRYNATRDVVCGSVVSGRPPQIENVEAIVGLFINTIPVRIQFQEETIFADLVQRIQNEALSSEPFHYYSLAKIQSEHLLKQRLLDHVIVFENYPVVEQIEGVVNSSGKARKDLNLQLVNASTYEQTNYDFNLIVVSTDRLVIKFEYNAHRYSQQAVQRIADHFKQLVDQVLADENAVVDRLTLLSEEEKQQVLITFNDTRRDCPEDKTIHALFQDQVESTPDQVAVVGINRAAADPARLSPLTYRELNDKANQLARLLRAKGVIPNTIVALMVGRSVEMAVGIMGSLKAGGAYLPLDANSPGDRLKYILESSGTDILVTDDSGRLAGIVPMTVDILDNGQYPVDTSNLDQAGDPFQAAYVIFTSGTTGRPKGVVVDHFSVINSILCRKEEYGLDSTVSMLQVFPFVFDGFVASFFPPLLAGARVIFPSEEQVKDTAKLRAVIAAHRVSHIVSVPSLFSAILEGATAEELTTLRAVTLAGDKLPVTLIELVREKAQHLELAHEYGVTEAAVMNTLFRHQEQDNQIKIGRPIWNTGIYILGSHGEPQAIGVPGELCIGGRGVARGYLNSLDMTAEKFWPSHLTNRLYRSGDLARWLPDGNIEFLGRIDQQVKVRGFRIELEEIENRLLKHKAIKEVAVIARTALATGDEKRDDKYLLAYIVAENPLTSVELREFLAKDLPDYMIPAHFEEIDRLPLTSIGKVDRKALANMKGQKLSSGVQYVAPQTETGKLLAVIWQEVLHLDKVGLNDNFFDLGGNSLNIIQVNSRMKEGLQRDLPLVTLFEYPTIASLLDYFQRQDLGGRSNEKEIERSDKINTEALDMMEQTLQIIDGETNDEHER